MRITSKGQVTIPQHVRERLGLWPHSEVEFVIEDDVAYIRKLEGENRRGSEIVSRLKGRGTIKLTTDEIMALTRGDD